MPYVQLGTFRFSPSLTILFTPPSSYVPVAEAVQVKKNRRGAAGLDTALPVRSLAQTENTYLKPEVVLPL